MYYGIWMHSNIRNSNFTRKQGRQSNLSKEKLNTENKMKIADTHKYIFLKYIYAF